MKLIMFPLWLLPLLVFTIILSPIIPLHHIIVVDAVSEMPQIVSTISVVSHDHVAQLGEGPYWDDQAQALYYVDALRSAFYRIQTQTRNTTSINLPSGLVSIIIPYAGIMPSQFVITNGNKLLKLDWDSGTTALLATVAPEHGGRERFNDAKCDSRGRLFIGTVMESESGTPIFEGGSLYRLEGSEFIKLTSGFTITNGMAWSNDAQSKSFYLNDSEGRKIYSFSYDIEIGTLSNKKVLIDCDQHPDFVPNEYPDGMAMDSYGFLWVAMWNGRRVVRINPETARVVDSIQFTRVQIPSSVAFGRYKGNFGLYVTTAATGIPEDKLQDDGKIHFIGIQGGEIHGFKP